MASQWIFQNARNDRKVILNPKKDARLMALYPDVDVRIRAPTKGVVLNLLVPTTLARKQLYEPYFKALFAQGNILILADEGAVLATESQFAPHLQACVIEGRSRGVGLIWATQRVRHTPGFIRSEADHFLIFKLQNASDRAALAEDTGVDWSEALDLRPHEFLYYNDTMEAPKRMAPLTGITHSNLSGG